jgi:DNA-binding SARP family transcriptional activator
MSTLTVCLFGKLQVQRGEQALAGLGSYKVQELLAYVLLHRECYHSREVLASLLWGNNTIARSKKYLRNAIWRLHSVLGSGARAEMGDVLLVDPQWVRLNPEADLWLDVAEFERAFVLVQGVLGQELNTQSAQTLQGAIQLYRGDLLEGWYQDWCLFERERLQTIYLGMLDKLMAYCEAHGKYEAGLAYGTYVLRYDVAHERTHRRLMRLHCLAGNRTAALRQYKRCVACLRQELDVDPSVRTVALYEQIRSDRLSGPGEIPAKSNETTLRKASTTLLQALRHLKQLQTAFTEAQHQLQEAIQTLAVVLHDQDRLPYPEHQAPIDVPTDVYETL